MELCILAPMNPTKFLILELVFQGVSKLIQTHPKAAQMAADEISTGMHILWNQAKEANVLERKTEYFELSAELSELRERLLDHVRRTGHD